MLDVLKIANEMVNLSAATSPMTAFMTIAERYPGITREQFDTISKASLAILEHRANKSAEEADLFVEAGELATPFLDNEKTPIKVGLERCAECGDSKKESRARMLLDRFFQPDAMMRIPTS